MNKFSIRTQTTTEPILLYICWVRIHCWILNLKGGGPYYWMKNRDVIGHAWSNI
jgi:hypothetical protein